MTTDNRTIRLRCSECDRDDQDFITPEALLQYEAEGGEGISEEQLIEDACRTVEPGKGSPMRWFTHVSWCPQCKAGQ